MMKLFGRRKIKLDKTSPVYDDMKIADVHVTTQDISRMNIVEVIVDNPSDTLVDCDTISHQFIDVESESVSADPVVNDTKPNNADQLIVDDEQYNEQYDDILDEQYEEDLYDENAGYDEFMKSLESLDEPSSIEGIDLSSDDIFVENITQDDDNTEDLKKDIKEDISSIIVADIIQDAEPVLCNICESIESGDEPLPDMQYKGQNVPRHSDSYDDFILLSNIMDDLNSNLANSAVNCISNDIKKINTYCIDILSNTILPIGASPEMLKPSIKMRNNNCINAFTRTDISTVDSSQFEAYDTYSLNHKGKRLGEISEHLARVMDNDYDVSCGEKLCLLPDSTNTFAANIKTSIGSNYKFIWRSVASSYVRYNNDNNNLGEYTVIDLMDDELFEVTIVIEKADNQIIYMKTKRNKCKNSTISMLTKSKLIKQYRYYIGQKFGLDANELICIDDCILNQIIVCESQADVIINGRVYNISYDDYKDFLYGYAGNVSYSINELDSKNYLIMSDYLNCLQCRTITVSDIACKVDEFNFRIDNNIPIWIEELPVLNILNVATGGRLGNYELVRKGTEANQNGVKKIRCKEKLTLPKNKTLIEFDIDINDFTDQKYKAVIELEQPLVSEVSYSVQLEFSFDNPCSYSFSISQSGDFDDEIKLVITTGESEKDLDKPFTLDFNNQDKIIKNIISKLEQVAGNYGRIQYIAKEIFNLWMSLDYKKYKINKDYSPSDKKTLQDNISIILKTIKNKEVEECNELYFNIVASLLVEIDADLIKRSVLSPARNNSNSDNKRIEYDIRTAKMCAPSLYKDAKIKRLDIRDISLACMLNRELLPYLLKEYPNIISEFIRSVKSMPNEIDNKDIVGDIRAFRDNIEFVLGILSFRGTKVWEQNKKLLNKIYAKDTLLNKIKNIEEKLYNELNSRYNSDANKEGDNSIEEIINNCIIFDKKNKPIKLGYAMSRIVFKNLPNNLNKMNPQSLAAIVYLSGKNDLDIVGCGIIT